MSPRPDKMIDVWKRHDTQDTILDFEDTEHDFSLLGLVGIRVKMITGDHVATAKAIGRQVGIGGDDGAITGIELEKLDESAFHKAVAETDVYALATPIRKQGIDVTTKVLSGRTSFSIIHEVTRSGHDLVVRVSKGAHSGRTGFFGTTSMRLLRKCPCAVWLVRPEAESRFGRVLAAIDPAPNDIIRDVMNNTVMDLATSVVKYEQGEMHVVHAWELFGEHLMKSRYKPGELAEAKRNAEAKVAAALDRSLSPYELTHDNERVHLVCDELGPGHAISKLANREQIDLIVMGTIARTGLTGALLGNTAEKVLDRIECSVLAIKPDGFVSPVSLPDS